MLLSPAGVLKWGAAVKRDNFGLTVECGLAGAGGGPLSKAATPKLSLGAGGGFAGAGSNATAPRRTWCGKDEAACYWVIVGCGLAGLVLAIAVYSMWG